MGQPPDYTTPDEYADWINQRIGAEVRRRREALRLSAYALGKDAGVTDQTILNIEQGLCPNGCWTGTLARMCVRFGTTLSELIEAAEGRGVEAGARLGDLERRRLGEEETWRRGQTPRDRRCLRQPNGWAKPDSAGRAGVKLGEEA